MAKAFINDTHLTNIANAIRTKLGVADTYLPSEMAGAVLSIPKRKVVDFNVSPITLNGAKANSLQYVKAYGRTEQNGTPTPTTPIDIYCNNGVLKYGVKNNLYDGVGIKGNYTGISTTNTSANKFTNQNPIEITPEKTYTIGFTETKPSWLSVSNLNWVVYDENGSVIEEHGSGSATSIPITFTARANSKWLRVSTFGTEVNTSYRVNAISKIFACVEGNILSKAFYADGLQEILALKANGTTLNTAVAEIMLSVGDFTDMQEIISGVVTRHVGVKVLNGTESWVKSSNGTVFYVDNLISDADTSADVAIFCTHLKGVKGSVVPATNSNSTRIYVSGLHTRLGCYPTMSDYADATAWATFLATQYANGTPVIIVYPLATATTETVTAQSLQTVEGDNTLEITQSALSGLEVECEYFLQ